MINSINKLIGAIVIAFLVSCQPSEKKHEGGSVKLSDVKVVNELDPVCEMSTSEHLKDTLTYQGKLYGFCSENCKEEFKANPEKFLNK
ncbi:YHS domain-containing protein [Apibacter raozihei]|uniref:YHS domain-containing protein n=1 Tax=Apibacter TaxID=1778601 RepID=UPI000FE44383|nr:MULTISPECIES: YHS domain-containing protein [Apibacter]